MRNLLQKSSWFAAFILAAALCAATPAQAKAGRTPHSKAVRLGQSVIVLNGPWRFHTGDDIAWADPKFDDSRWETQDISTTPGVTDPTFGSAAFTGGWTVRGHPGYSGFAWYRLKVQIENPGGPLALMLPDDVDDAYQVFIDGRYLGEFGDFSGARPRAYNSRAADFHLPDLPAGEFVTIALRFWMAGSTLASTADAGGLHEPPQIGLASAADALTRLRLDDVLRAYSSAFILMFFYFQIAVLLFILYFMDRRELIFPWLGGVYVALTLVELTLVVAAWTTLIDMNVSGLLTDVLLRPLILGGWLMTWWLWFDLRRYRWIPWLIWGATAASMLLTACVREPLLGWIIPQSAAGAIGSVSVAVRMVCALLLEIIVVLGIRRNGREGWLVLPAVLLLAVSTFQSELALLHIHTSWFVGGLQITLGTLAQLGLLGSVFILLIRRFQRSQHYQHDLEQDLKQAQQVQQLLMPESSDIVPGFMIETEYRPAQQVGGDFFQIIPGPDGSVLIVVGDVAGKGAQAGMLVALLVGAIRTSVQVGWGPAQILDALNQRLCGREHVLATCMVLHINKLGWVEYANAGHLPPYLNGEELPVEGALPLGVMPEMSFSLGSFWLAQGDSLMLMSDGVVEATDHRGNLFGFERLRKLLEQPMSAEALAVQAQEFGQRDDVLVLRLVRLSVDREALHYRPVAVMS